MGAISSAGAWCGRTFYVLALAGMTALSAAPAAAEAPRALEPPRLTQTPEPLCFCWNDGRKIPEGASACIRTTQGRRLAACGRVINMMSWQVTEQPCPES
ncbi:hypothetical protein [Bosea sp. Leaf344]|uniref:hypothetical protein n=1 Tax=Bosea sp. Leaf344 TaxID=1736346 RepID=UPI000A5CF8C8|nr:hypothetical protein [Bosea sp. Leaf344]